MKQSIVQVIAYLLEMASSLSFDNSEHSVEQRVMKQKLEDVGFARDIIESAFDWLRELIEQQKWYAGCSGENLKSVDLEVDSSTIRIFSLEESVKMDMEVRNFLLALEFAKIIDTKMREIVICQLMQLQQKVVGLADAKWVVLLVLMSKSNRNVDDIRNYLLATMAINV